MKFYLRNITSAIKIAITEHSKVEKEILKYEKDSNFVTGLKEFLEAVETGKGLQIIDDEDKVILETIDLEYLEDIDFNEFYDIKRMTREDIAFEIGKTYFQNNIHFNPYPYLNSQSKAWFKGYEYAKKTKKTFQEWLNDCK